MGKSTIFDKAMDYIDDHIELTKQEIRVGLYGYLRYDTTKISAFITILTGSSTLDQYITSRKLYFAALELENNSDKKVTEIGQKYYSESSSFSRVIKRQYGYSPKQIRDEKPPIPDNRLTIEDYIDKPTSYLAKVLDHYQNDDFSQSGCLEDDYLESFVEATNEYGFSTETCCLISMLSYHMNIPFAYMLEKCFDMVIDIHYYQRYNKVLQDRGLMDYDDQIIYAYIILGKYPDILKYYRDKYKFISVDEAQDTSKRQHAVIRLLVGENNIFMVGDEDQSIYGFRGAYPEALMRFRDDYANPFIMYMERNYRSTQEIVCAAQKFIEKNRKRHPKHMVSNRGKGEPIERIVVASRQEQYSYLVNDLRKNDGRTAILYRDNECAVPLIDLLIRSNIPYYTLQDQNSFFSSRTVIDMIAFLKLSINPYDTKSFMQIYYKCGMRLKKQFALDVCNLSKKNHITLTDPILMKYPVIHLMMQWCGLASCHIRLDILEL